MEHCKKLSSELGDQNVILNFVKPSANKVAHYLARHTSSLADRSWTQGDIVPACNVGQFEAFMKFTLLAKKKDNGKVVSISCAAAIYLNSMAAS